jgi:peptide/nickel transport system permease protein
MMSGFARLLRRFGTMVVIVLGIAVINFFLLRLAPGDAADVLAGEAGAATPEYMAALRQQFGLDKSLLAQFALYLGQLAKLNLGFSHRYGMSVFDLIVGRLPATLLLMVSSILFATVLGVVLGFIAAQRAGKITDSIIMALSLLFYATPVFWVGLMLIVVFSVWLDLLPVGGMTTVEANLAGSALAIDVLRHLVLPSVTLGLFYLAVYMRLTRAAMIEVSNQDFIRTAIAKGLHPYRIATRHMLRNALLPIITMLGVQIGSIFGGAVLVETIFSWPGLGRLAFDSLFQRDLNLLLGILLCSSVMVVLVNAIVDAIYMLVDPRIQVA